VCHRFDWYREIIRDRLFTEDEYRRFHAAIVHHRTKGDRGPKRLALVELLLAAVCGFAKPRFFNTIPVAEKLRTT
jgi:hypothetical protein